MKKNQGFAMITVLVLLVLLASIIAVSLHLIKSQEESLGQYAVSEKVYQAAKTGLEYGAYQSVRMNNCTGTTLTLPDWPEINIVLSCQRSLVTEGSSVLNVDTWIATACNSTSCPGTPGASYVERQLKMTVTTE